MNSVIKMTEFIRDRIVCGIHSDIVRRLLLREPELTLDKAYELCIMHEMADLNSQGINNDPYFMPSVNAIREKREKKSRKVKMVGNCKYCGEDHPVRQCPAYGVQCEKCEKLNHFTKVCLSVSDNTPRRPYAPRRRSQPDSQQLHEIDYDDDQQQEEIMEHYVIEAVDIPGSQSEIHITAIASGNRFDLKIDSGAK